MIFCNVAFGLLLVLELLLWGEGDVTNGCSWAGDDAWGSDGGVGNGGGPLLPHGGAEVVREVFLRVHCCWYPVKHILLGHC